MTGKREQRLLLASAGGTLTLALVAIGVGLWSGAKAIVFDGMYDTVDAGMTVAAWFVAGLVARGDDRRFQFGYWHIEPLLAFLNGAVLLFACFYALVDGVGAVLGGGRPVDFGAGTLYAVASTAVSLGIWAVVRRAAAGAGSALLDLDARSWLLGGLLSAGLCVSFAGAMLLEATAWDWLSAYLDPAILIVLAVAMAPLPARTLLTAGREILQIAPRDLDAAVGALARDVAERHGFAGHSSHVTRAGRAQFIEIGLLASSPDAAVTPAAMDAIRQEVADALGGLRPGTWLSIDVTADRRWI